MKRSVVLALCAAMLLAVAAAPAWAEQKFATDITIINTDEQSLHDTIVYGLVDSSKQQCIANRTVKIFATSPVSTTQVDTARTSNRGAWAGRGDFSGAGGVKAVVTRKEFGRPHHRKVCKSASDLFPFV